MRLLKMEWTDEKLVWSLSEGKWYTEGEKNFNFSEEWWLVRCDPQGSERLLLNDEMRDSWSPEEMNSIQGQRRGWIAQSFCVIKFY